MSVKQAVIADAGVSSRFLPIVKTIPKSFMPIGSKPVIQILVEECFEAGIENIIIVCRKETKNIFKDYFTNIREDLESFLDNMNKSDRFDSVKELENLPHIEYIIQDPKLPYGTAAPIISAKSYLKETEPFLVLQGDDLVIAQKRDCKILVDYFNKHPEYSALMMAEEITPNRIHKYGSIKLKDNEELDYIVEKPTKEEAPSFLATYGRFLFKYDYFSYLDPKRIGKDKELWNVDALTEMAKTQKVKVIKNEGEWVTTGDPDSYLDALIKFKEFNKKNN